ncbi:MAG TPA: hypothetical protein VFK90_08700 [Anaeromyxobacter sp.]|nr:hypothetical protein [Anaeromyxobacter sp.]
MAFGAVFAAILAVVAAADVDPAGSAQKADEDSVEAVDSADPGVVRLAPAEASPTAAAATPAGKALADSAPLLLDRADRVNGGAIERLLEPSGEIVEHEVNRAGTVQSCRTVGSLFTLRVLEQRPGPAGGVVEVVRDASGALLRFAVGPDGEPRAVALLAPPPR